MMQKEEGDCALGAEADPLFQAYMFVVKLIRITRTFWRIQVMEAKVLGHHTDTHALV